jgi:hypothetical protein
MFRGSFLSGTSLIQIETARGRFDGEDINLEKYTGKVGITALSTFEV